MDGLKAARELLGMAASATAQDIKSRFRALAKAAHPDTGGTAERFVALKTLMKRSSASVTAGAAPA
jgi:curved DNA-binding protein CbpA